MSNVRNVFEAILKYGHDEDFSPNKEGFEATNAPAGSEDKIKILRRRVEQGTPLWHRNDRHDYSGLTGCLLYTSPSPRDATLSRMPSSA